MAGDAVRAQAPYRLCDEAVNRLRCPACGGEFERCADTLACFGCAARYPIRFGIVDLRRDGPDRTAGLDARRDTALAEALDQAAPGRSYFELYDLYCALAQAAADGAPARLTPQRAQAEAHYRRLLEETHVAHGRAALDKIAWFLEGGAESWQPGGVALESGTGLGQFLDGFSERFSAVIAVDLSMAYLVLSRALMEERGRSNVLLVCGNVEHLPLAGQAVDFVHFDNMIEHVLHPDAAVAEARRVLRPGGLLSVVSPNRLSLYVEPHTRVPAFGWFPEPVRRWLAWRCGGVTRVDDLRLHSLGDLTGVLRRALGQGWTVQFLPRRLPRTVRGGRLRGFAVWALGRPVLGRLVDALFNSVLLGVMPYHVALWIKPSGASAPALEESLSCAASPAG